MNQQDHLDKLANDVRMAWVDYNAVPPTHITALPLLKKWQAARKALVEAQAKAA